MGVRVPPALRETCTPSDRHDRHGEDRRDDDDTRANPTPARDREARRSRCPARISLFYRQVIAELRKVIWPTRKELVTYTSVVIVFVLVVIAYVTVLDFGFSKAVLAVFG